MGAVKAWEFMPEFWHTCLVGDKDARGLRGVVANA